MRYRRFSSALASFLLALSVNAQTQTFDYDSDGRLKKVNQGNASLEFKYDPEGNLTKSLQDQDGDTLSDEFEKLIIDADPSDSVKTFADVSPEQDFDLDGQSNASEQAAFTFPADGKSPSLIQLNANALSGGTFTMEMVLLPGQTYKVTVTENLADWQNSLPSYSLTGQGITEITQIPGGYYFESANNKNVNLVFSFAENVPDSAFIRFEVMFN